MSKTARPASTVSLSVVRLEDRTTPTMAQGFLDYVGGVGTSFQATGWARDPDRPNDPISVHMYIDNNFVSAGTANLWRSDVGAHAYSLPVPAGYLDGNTHSVRTYAIDLTGDPNPQLGGSPRSFVNTRPQGYLDLISNFSSVVGWAKDPDSTGTPTAVHVYIDGGHAATGTTNQYRPDLGGYYGYDVTIPAKYQDDRQSHWIEVYAIDSQAGGTYPHMNVRLIGSGKTYVYGDATVKGADAGGKGPIEVHTGGRFAGAIDSIRWNGHEFINKSDHGREAQTAVWGVPQSELSEAKVQQYVQSGGNVAYFLPRYNPTEAGTELDGSKATSTSRLNYFTHPQSNRVTGETRMALWTHDGQNVEGNTVWPGTMTPMTALPSADGKGLSNYLTRKDVTVGHSYAGRTWSNVIRDQVTIQVPAADNLVEAQFFPLIVYTEADLTETRRYDFNSGAAVAANTPGLDRRFPVLQHTNDAGKSYAIALITKPVSTPAAQFYIADGTGHGGSRYGSYGTIGRTFNSHATPGGNYVYDNFVIVGSYASVVATLNDMRGVGFFNGMT